MAQLRKQLGNVHSWRCKNDHFSAPPAGFAMSSTLSARYQSFREFYPFYLSQHANLTCRRLHVVGSSLVLTLLGYALASQQWWTLLALPVLGYGFAWVGHFVFERNKPATFQYPLYSFMGDWLMFWQVLTGRLPR
jgi:hypothetical protein